MFVTISIGFMPSSGPEHLNLSYSSPQDPGLVGFHSIFSCVCLVWVFWRCFVVVSHLHRDGVLPSELFQVTRNSFQAQSGVELMMLCFL